MKRRTKGVGVFPDETSAQLRKPLVNPKVLFLDHAGVLSGAELCLLDIARNYAQSSRVVLFADGPFRERLEKAEIAVEVLRVPRAVSGVRREATGMRDLQAVPGLLELVRRVARLARSYDVLYTNSQKAHVVGSLAGKLASRPVIWHLHDILTTDHFSRTHRSLAVSFANHLVSRVIANSRASARAFAESGGKAKKVHVVYNGIDSVPFETAERAQVDMLKRALGVSGVPVVGAFSRLAPWKGQHVLLEALTYLPEAHALLVGDALFGEEAYEQSLREQASSLGIANRVHFMGFREDVPQLMKLSDLVVHASTAPEPFGRMIVEGMLARRPVVASSAGGAVEIIENGVTGLLIPPDDPKMLAAALRELLNYPSKSRRLAENGYAEALKRFSLRAMLEGVNSQICSVLQENEGSRKAKS